jgi:hypothetical protein
MKWAGHVASIGEMRNEHKMLAENLKRRDHLGETGVEERKTLKWILNKRCENLGWIQLVQDRVQWQAFVNTVMNLHVQQKTGNFLTE